MRGSRSKRGLVALALFILLAASPDSAAAQTRQDTVDVVVAAFSELRARDVLAYVSSQAHPTILEAADHPLQDTPRVGVTSRTVLCSEKGWALSVSLDPPPIAPPAAVSSTGAFQIRGDTAFVGFNFYCAKRIPIPGVVIATPGDGHAHYEEYRVIRREGEWIFDRFVGGSIS